jgi:hypothetical protein
MFVAGSLLRRLCTAAQLAFVYGFAGALILYFVIAVTGSTVDNIRAGAAFGGTLGLILGFMKRPRPVTDVPESKYSKLFKASVYILGTALSGFALVVGLFQARIHLPALGNRTTMDSVSFVSWSERPTMFIICAAIWAVFGALCFHLAKSEFSEARDLNSN